ncbi:unnamed protein product [Calicophoron daubneyi]|uniref:Uncharacterized protein n=1 Tax=Calicophoron daubneyi TaxID=300641 RepID=A0AAV2TWN4_CALDB
MDQFQVLIVIAVFTTCNAVEQCRLNVTGNQTVWTVCPDYCCLNRTDQSQYCCATCHNCSTEVERVSYNAVVTGLVLIAMALLIILFGVAVGTLCDTGKDSTQSCSDFMRGRRVGVLNTANQPTSRETGQTVYVIPVVWIPPSVRVKLPKYDELELDPTPPPSFEELLSSQSLPSSGQENVPDASGNTQPDNTVISTMESPPPAYEPVTLDGSVSQV